MFKYSQFLKICGSRIEGDCKIDPSVGMAGVNCPKLQREAGARAKIRC